MLGSSKIESLGNIFGYGGVGRGLRTSVLEGPELKVSENLSLIDLDREFVMLNQI